MQMYCKYTKKYTMQEKKKKIQPYKIIEILLIWVLTLKN